MDYGNQNYSYMLIIYTSLIICCTSAVSSFDFVYLSDLYYLKNSTCCTETTTDIDNG